MGGDDLLSKNKRIVVISVGILLTLTIAVLFLRTPNNQKPSIPEALPPPAAVQQVDPEPATESKRDESHEKVEKVIDQATETVASKVPGLWDQVKNTGKWFMEFDTKHALILLGLGVFLVTVLSSGQGNKRDNRKR